MDETSTFTSEHMKRQESKTLAKTHMAIRLKGLSLLKYGVKDILAVPHLAPNPIFSEPKSLVFN